METLAEKILIELVKIAETDTKWMKSVRECAKEDGHDYYYHVANLAWAYALQFEKIKFELKKVN